MALQRLFIAVLSATAFVGANALIVPRCETNQPTSTVTASLEEPPACTNLVDNYSFEEEGTGWTIATGTVKAGDLSIPAQHEDSYVYVEPSALYLLYDHKLIYPVTES